MAVSRNPRRDALLAALRSLFAAFDHKGEERDACLRIASMFLAKALGVAP